MSDDHMSDSRFGKIFGTMIAAMVGLTVVLIVLANAVSSTLEDEMASLKVKNKARELVMRIEPIGKFKIGKVAEAEKPETVAKTEAVSGESTYNSACSACHNQGVAGAPKFGDGGAWNQRVAQGKDVLYEHALSGYQGKVGYMPPKGGNASLSDVHVKAAVDYILENVK